MDSISFSFSDWCRRRGISRSRAYALLRAGDGPRTYTIGKSRYVSVEADAEWLAQQESRPAPLMVPSSLKRQRAR